MRPEAPHQRQYHNKITSFEIAEYMINSRAVLSARELADILAVQYPQFEVDSREVYLRLRAIAASPFSSVHIYDEARPRRFKIMSLDPEFYRRSRGPRRFSARLLEALKMNDDDKERRENQLCRSSREIWDDVVRSRQSF